MIEKRGMLVVELYKKDGSLKQGGILKALGVKVEDKNIICAVGGGGKTTLVEAMAKEYQMAKKMVVCTTTTKIMLPSYGQVLLEENEEMLRQLMKKEGQGIVTIALPWKGEKLTGVSEDFLKKIFATYPVVLIEADGSKGLPTKVPNDKEPVIPKETTIVLGIQGIDACGKPIKKVCHRPERVALLLGKSEEDVITTEDMATLYLEERALRKGCLDKEYWAIIQKVDTKERMELAKQIVAHLEKRGFKNSLICRRKE